MAKAKAISMLFSIVIPSRKYFTILSLSTKTPIAPAAKMKTSFLRVEAVRKAALIAPPTPNMPELNPVKIPPVIAKGLLAGIFQFLFKITIILLQLKRIGVFVDCGIKSTPAKYGLENSKTGKEQKPRIPRSCDGKYKKAKANGNG